MIARDRQEFYDRLKYTIIDSEKEELDEILRTLIRKENSEQFYRELFDGCYIDSAGEIVPVKFFSGCEASVPLSYSLYTLLAYAPDDFPLKKGITSIRFIAPEGEARPPLRFPRRLDFIPNLEQLGLVGWDTAIVPKELVRCRGLKYLSLRNNRFTTLPEPLLNIPHLTHLDLSYNLIDSLPDEIDRMTSLQALNLKGNRLTRLNSALGRMASLEHLDVSCNRLEESPDFLKEMGSLSYLNVAYNELSVEDEAELDRTGSTVA
ncbi:MAG: leucine-rich repeat domain-containing protein [Spirochaetales bacterium]|nr:leucine-rich repeat domain-containing protein [Spirochaetales bacterium]